MNILLMCMAGASTSIVMKKMSAALAPDQQDWKIEAHPFDKMDEVVDEFDVILLGPQIAYKKKELSAKAEEYGKPLDSIAPVDYAMGNGAKILAQAIALVENYQK